MFDALAPAVIARLSPLVLLFGLSGCAMCSNELDGYYAAYGGKHARENRLHGRVGSIIDPASETTESLLVDPQQLPEPSSAESPSNIESDDQRAEDEKQEEANDAATQGPSIESPFPAQPQVAPSPAEESDQVPADELEPDTLLETAESASETAEFIP